MINFFCFLQIDCIILTHLAVVNRVVHGDVPLEGDPHRHEDGGGHGDGDGRVQEVGEGGLKYKCKLDTNK